MKASATVFIFNRSLVVLTPIISTAFSPNLSTATLLYSPSGQARNGEASSFLQRVEH